MNAQAIKQSITISEALSWYGIKPNRSGCIPCIFHKEQTASMKIYSDHYHCYGCGAHGDVIDLVAQLDGCSFSEAFQKLGGQYDDPEDVSRLREEAMKRAEKADTVQFIIDSVRKSLADAITLTREAMKEHRPKAQDEEYPRKWIEAANDLPILEYWWTLLFVEDAFTWEGGAIREIVRFCKECSKRYEHRKIE